MITFFNGPNFTCENESAVGLNGGKILLGNNTGCVAGMLQPIMFQSAGFSISTGLPTVFQLAQH